MGLTESRIQRHTPALIAGGAILVFLLIVLTSSCATVDAGHAGVRVTMGQVTEASLGEGIHLKFPFAQSVETVDCRKAVATITVAASSNDLQTVQTTVAINYRAIRGRAWSLYQNVGADRGSWEEVIIDPAVQEVVKAVTAGYIAELLVTEREAVKQKITEKIISRCAKDGHLEIEQVSITNFQFSAAFDNAIEEKQVADQQAEQAMREKRRRETDAAAERAVREQQSEAEAFQIERSAAAQAIAVEARATAEATATLLRAEAEAEAVRLRAAAEAEALTLLAGAAEESALRSRFIERWDGQLPRVIAGDSNASPLAFLIPLEGAAGDDD